MKQPETQENNPERPPALAGACGSVMDRAPMRIKAYLCCLCDRVHREKWPIFKDHYDANQKHYGWKPAPNIVLGDKSAKSKSLNV